MKFEDIRITAKTGGGQEMTLGHMFHGMQDTIRELAGAGQTGDFVTKQELQQGLADIEEAMNDLGEQFVVMNAAIAALERDNSDLKVRLGEAETGLGQATANVSALSTELNALAGRVDALEAAANAN